MSNSRLHRIAFTVSILVSSVLIVEAYQGHVVHQEGKGAQKVAASIVKLVWCTIYEAYCYCHGMRLYQSSMNVVQCKQIDVARTCRFSARPRQCACQPARCLIDVLKRGKVPTSQRPGMCAWL